MSVFFPQIDQIMHASLESDAYSQKEYVKLMNKSNNFINLSFQDYLDRISREYNYKSIVDILNVVSVVLDEEEDACESQIIFDDFVRNASLVSQSLQKIINSPSRKLVKIDKNVPANKVTKFDSRTMTWLSRRPGVTIEEKISPKNIIPTKVTYFTADTVENRHTMYLFDILYDYLYEKVYPDGLEPKCESCTYTEKNCYKLYEKLKNILFLKQKVRTTDLKEVLKQKQLRQNNKLLSDKEYKQIWDAVRDIDYYEQNCKSVWEHLKERYQFISFLFVCSKISKLKGIKVFDEYSQLVDNEGKIFVVNNDGANYIKFYDENANHEIIVSLSNEKINVIINEYRAENNVKFNKFNIYSKSFDLTNIFDEFDNIQKYEEEYKNLVLNIDLLNKKLNSIQEKMDEYNDKIAIIQELAIALNMKNKVVDTDGKEKE